MKNYPVKFTKL